MPQFKLKDIFVLTAIIAAAIGMLRIAMTVHRGGDTISPFWLFLAGLFFLFVAPILYWQSISQRSRKPSTLDTRRRLNFWSSVMLVVTVFCTLGYFGSDRIGDSTVWRPALAVIGCIAAIMGGILGTMAKRLRPH